jgi:hypothetical protein
MELREWCAKTIVASYDETDRDVVWQEVLRYLDWLRDLRICPAPVE